MILLVELEKVFNADETSFIEGLPLDLGPNSFLINSIAKIQDQQDKYGICVEDFVEQ